MKTKFFALTIALILFVNLPIAFGQATCVADPKLGQCGDCVDNQVGDGIDYGFGKGAGDGKADRNGLDKNGDGKIEIEPDPACIVADAKTEFSDKQTGSRLVPCSDKCSFSDVFRMLNNIILFFFEVILIPLFVIIIMFLGYKYITAQGNPNALKMLKSTGGNMVIGIVIILCAWLVVRTILGMIVGDDFKDIFMFFE